MSTIFSKYEIVKTKLALENVKLFCDMDQVLTDFDGYFHSKTGMYPKSFISEFSEADFWRVVHSDDNWWRNLQWTRDGKRLWGSITKYNPTVLSAPDKEDLQNCISQKKEWLQRELGAVPAIFENNKYIYASPTAILIDDMEHNIESWIEHGGIGILHTSTANTLMQLQEIIEKI